MIRNLAPLIIVAALFACTFPGPVPEFAAKHFEPFNRADTVAIALREWRLFGQPIDALPMIPSTGEGSLNADADDGTDSRLSIQKPERLPGLWQRVGEYWWIGLGTENAAHAWTGKHDSAGHVFAANIDGRYAWSAAFICYVMRTAGAGDRFPYSPNHATYVNAAAYGRSPILQAFAPENYAPQLGDLICHGRADAAALRFKDLPTDHLWPGHCAIVVKRAAGQLAVIGGNVNDAVSMSYVPVQANGRLLSPDDPSTGYPWFVVLRVIYDAEAERISDERQSINRDLLAKHSRSLGFIVSLGPEVYRSQSQIADGVLPQLM